MDSLSPASVKNSQSINYSLKQAQLDSDRLVIANTLQETQAQDSVNLSDSKLVNSLGLTAQQIVEKLNELLKKSLPDGIESLKPEQVTPEATADRIVKGVTAFYSAYAKQHPELEGEDLLDSFMQTIRSGIDQGYEDAYGILEGLGAFEFDGVREGVEQTKLLIEEKLKAYEDNIRASLKTDIPKEINSTTSQTLLEQGGVNLLDIAA